MKVPIIYHVVLSGGYLQRVLVAGLEIVYSKKMFYQTSSTWWSYPPCCWSL